MPRKSSLKARSKTVQAAIAAGGTGEPDAAGKRGNSGGRVIALSVRLDEETHEALRQIAFQERTSIQKLISEGVDFVLRKHKA